MWGISLQCRSPTDFWSTLHEIPLQDPHCLVSSYCYILNMGGPGQVTADGDAQVLAGICCFQCLPMGKVAGCQDLCFLGMMWMTLHKLAFAMCVPID